MMRNRICGWTVFLVLGLYIAPTTAAWILVDIRTAGRLYSDIHSIPHRSVALLLACPQMRTGGGPNLNFTSRIQTASRLFHAGKIDSIFVSGDDSPPSHHESEDMKKALIENGVPEARIYCDHGGTNTRASIVHAKQRLDHVGITIITQDWHSQRALFQASHCGLDAIAFAAPTVGWPNRLRSLRHEHLARVKALLDVVFVRCSVESEPT